MSKEVKLNDSIKVHYTGRIETGDIFDSSVERDPLAFTVGEGNLLKGFEDAVVGMKINDSKEIHIPFAEGYGELRPDLIAKVEKKNLSPEITPTVGMELMSKYPDGQEVVVRIVEVEEESITVDANHPLAGQDLTFEITLVEIEN